MNQDLEVSVKQAQDMAGQMGGADPMTNPPYALALAVLAIVEELKQLTARVEDIDSAHGQTIDRLQQLQDQVTTLAAKLAPNPQVVVAEDPGDQQADSLGDVEAERRTEDVAESL